MDVEGAVAVAFGPCSDRAQQQRAEAYLEQLQQQPELWGYLVQAIQRGLHTLSPQLAFWVCQALSTTIAHRPHISDDDLSPLARAGLQWLSTAAHSAQPIVPPHVLNKFAQALATLYARVQPQRWPAFCAELRGCCGGLSSPSGQDVFLRLVEAIDDYATSSHDADHQHIRVQMVATGGVAEVLAGISAVLRDSASAALHSKALGALQKYAAWVDLRLVTAVEGLVECLWGHTKTLTTAPEACDCLIQLLNREQTPSLEPLQALQVPGQYPPLLHAALAATGETAAADTDDDRWTLQEYGAKVAYLGAVTGNILLRCAAAEGPAASSAGAALLAALPWLARVGLLNVAGHEQEAEAVGGLYCGLFARQPDATLAALQIVLQQAAEGPPQRLVALLTVVHGMGKGIPAATLQDPHSPHSRLLLQVLSLAPWCHASPAVALAAFRVLRRHAALFASPAAPPRPAVEALLGTTGLLHPTSASVRRVAGESFLKFARKVPGVLMGHLEAITAFALQGLQHRSEGAEAVLEALGGLLGCPAAQGEGGARCGVEVVAALVAATRRATEAGEVGQLCGSVMSLTAFARGCNLGLPFLPFAPAAEAVLAACQAHGQARELRQAAMDFLLEMVTPLPAAQLAPVAAELTGAVLPVADVPEAAGALRMVAKLTEAVPAPSLTDVLQRLFPAVLDRVTVLTQWAPLRLDLVPGGVVPVLSEEGRQQAGLQAALARLARAALRQGYGAVLQPDLPRLLSHFVNAAASMLDLDLVRDALDLLTALLDATPEELALQSALPATLQALFQPRFDLGSVKAGGVLLATANLHRGACGRFGPPTVVAVLRQTLEALAVPGDRVAQCMEFLTGRGSAVVYRNALKMALEDMRQVRADHL
eukprot:EG_transcript_2548